MGRNRLTWPRGRTRGRPARRVNPSHPSDRDASLPRPGEGKVMSVIRTLFGAVVEHRKEKMKNASRG
jgi:hypothetical protein